MNGLSLEVTRQADRIRRRSHGQDWPGAASAMSELEDAVEVLGRLVNTTLHQAIAAGRSEQQHETDEGRARSRAAHRAVPVEGRRRAGRTGAQPFRRTGRG